MTQTIDLAVPFRVPFYAPFYAAVSTGAYRRHGLEVRMRVSGSGAAVVDSLLKGESDVAWGGPARVMHELDADPNSSLRCFCSVVNKDPFMLVGRSPNPGFTLGRLPDYTLGTVSEVPTPWLCLQDDLRQQGIDPGKIRLLTGRSMSENAQLVSEGRLDLAQLFEPHASELELRLKGAAWFFAADRGETAYTSFIATAATLKNRRETMKSLVLSIAETLSWLKKAGPESLYESVADFFDDIPAAVLRASLTRYFKLGIWSDSPIISEESFTRLAQALHRAKSVAKMPRYNDCVDAAIIEEALAA